MRNGKKIVSTAVFLAFFGVVWVYVLGQTDEAATPPAEPPEIPMGAYAPKQPIDYSHKLHAGDLNIECKFCHTYARRSRAAGIPAVEQCMACHQIMSAQKEPIQLLAEKFDKKEPIEWIKVHDLPDYVYFSHKRHVQAGFECQECHGQVEEMEVVYREAPLTMGWCVNCHQDNLDKGAPVDCLTCHK